MYLKNSHAKRASSQVENWLFVEEKIGLDVHNGIAEFHKKSVCIHNSSYI